MKVTVENKKGLNKDIKVFIDKKTMNSKKMNKTTLVTILYILGILIGALFLNVWSADTSFVKTISVFVWTIIFLIALFYLDKNEKKYF